MTAKHVSMCVLICILQAASVIGYPMQAATTTTATTVANNVNWNPADGLWADWIKCQGMSCDDWEIQQEKMQQLNQLLGISIPAPAVTTKKPASGSGSGGLLGGLLGGFQNVSYQTLYVQYTIYMNKLN